MKHTCIVCMINLQLDSVDIVCPQGGFRFKIMKPSYGNYRSKPTCKSPKVNLSELSGFSARAILYWRDLTHHDLLNYKHINSKWLMMMSI